ncbi:hypothetical protein F5Y15DRAFT_179426 [Xylariaceae sp. FL0016]|nr:hypothetical protein F5Y15DRAFT_179426 [Xylariaceae sp. FL0016]
MMLTHNNNYSRNHQPHQPYNNQQHYYNLANNSNITALTLDAAAALAATQRYRNSSTPQQSHQQLDRHNLSQVPDLMPSDSWMLQGQQTPRSNQRFGHHRESSLSSLGSNGPASPFNPNTSNPHIAVTDPTNDGFHDMSGVTDSNYAYGLGKPLNMADISYANVLTSLDASGAGVTGPNATGNISLTDGLPSLTTPRHQKRGLAPAAELSNAPSLRSHPVSVASSTAGGDSPATPSYHEPEEDLRRTKNAFAHTTNVPKLDRTMTDIYNDELYNPNFTITSASPPSQAQMVVSPNNDLFAKRLQDANSQHLSAAQSPVSVGSRDRSPFRHGSPYASTVDEFPRVGLRLESAQQIREKRKAQQDARELQQQMTRNANQQQGTPSTISPKDAMLDFPDGEDYSNAPLFPQETTATRAPSQQANPSFQSMATTPMQSAFNFSMPTSIQIPQQYPFVSQRQQQQTTPSVSNFSRMSSADGSASDSSEPLVEKPARTNADSGTYTCTYHGCTLRFETPALLQKHKREGHRQANALNHIRSPTTVMSGSVLNSQAGPHRCDRINPSTGKPCDTVFSRPYDLTRHEDTIHNARKQKVRCDLCTEEKTFSRADALTRHYRVCHPDVEFPGKHRKRAM